jgi:hypothetical protein
MQYQRNWRFWRARRDQFDTTAIRPDGYSVGQLRAELEQQVVQVLRRAGIDLSCVAVEVSHQSTIGPQRTPQLACMLRIVQWERRSALRLLLGLAHIERAMRRTVDSSWLAHSIHFGGVWLHASTATLAGPAVHELSAALGSLGTFGPETAGHSMWSSEGEPRALGAPKDLDCAD